VDGYNTSHIEIDKDQQSEIMEQYKDADDDNNISVEE